MPTRRVVTDLNSGTFYTVSQVIGYIKGNSAIHMARVYGEKNLILPGSTFGSEVILFRLLVGIRR